MYSCEDVVNELSAFVDNDVTTELRREIERHLAQCRTCQVLLDSTRKTLQLVTESQSFDIPDDVSERLVARIMARLRGGGEIPSTR